MSGEGSIYRRRSDGRWVATISRGPRGQRQIASVYTRSKAEAVLALSELRARVGPLNGHTLTVGAYLEAHVTLALGTGLRQGEQLGLAWQDIDFDGLRIHVRKELARVNGHYARVEPKTERSKRSVPLAPAVAAAMRHHRDALIALGFAPVSSGPVFVNRKGQELNGSWLTHRWYDLLEEAGINRRPWKILRATFGSQLYAAGVPDRTISDLLGHSRTHTTHRHYIATTNVDVTDALEGLVG